MDGGDLRAGDFVGIRGSGLDLVVLYMSDVERSRRFYGLVGAEFAPEQHGHGPEHYSAVLGSVVFELYPRGDRPATRARVGFRVDDLDETVARLRAEGFVVERGSEAAITRRRAVATDPDGNKVELSERPARRADETKERSTRWNLL